MKRALLIAAFSGLCSLGLGSGCGGREHADSPDTGPKADAKTDAQTDKAPADLAPAVDLTGGETGPMGSCMADEHNCSGACFKNNDLTSCGTCGHDCTGLPNVKAGGVQCQAGKCVVATDGCVAGFAHCTTNPEDVCETDVSKPENCGACGKKCTTAAPFCSNVAGAQTCVLTCDGTTPDKCDTTCVNLKTDVANCGTCGKACNLPNADATCVNGACVLSKCKDGYGDCSNTDPGCETQLNSGSNCGACGKSCAVTNGSASCTSGTCGPVTCNPGWGNCDTTPDCETQLNTTTNCGKCGTACDTSKPLCSTVNGLQTCVSDCTAAAPMKCGNKCVDPKTDPANCGTCGMACRTPSNGNPTCVDTSCNFTCNPNFRKCGADCIPTDAQCNGACVAGLKPCGTACVPMTTCCTNGATGCPLCQVCGTGTCNPQSDGTTCGNGMECRTSQCLSCGGNGQTCCSGSRCNAGFACAGGTCAPACVPGGSCTSNPGANNCIYGVWTCAGPTASRTCSDDTTKKPAGSDCASGKVCNTTGSCVTRCTAGGSCTSNPDQQNCINGVLSCDSDWATAVCQNGSTQKSAGSACANGTKVCNAAGNCVNKCKAGDLCTTNPGRENCAKGVTTCASDLASPTCADSGNKPAGSTCASGTKICDGQGHCKVTNSDACTKHADCFSGLCRIRAGDGSTICSSCGLINQDCCPGPAVGTNFCTDGSTCGSQPETQIDPAFITGFCR